MLADCRILGLIPARGGSVALPRKNVRPLAGKPLVAWTIAAALESKYLDRVVLSSDDDEIMKVARTWGCEVPFRRPNHLATAEADAIDVVLHALEELPGFDYVVLLQPTSPLRIAPDIDGAIEKCMTECAPSCVSVVRVEKSLRWMYHLSDDQRMLPALAGDEIPSRRQGDRATYALNGAIYVTQVNELRKQRQFVTEATVAYVMPPERSPDVDTELDLHWCEFLLSRQTEPNGKTTGGAR
jgi:N-acylneuraminate cytidylyltransferase